MTDEDGRTRRAAESREARRAQILDTALQVFSEKGYHGASVSDLVAAAGVARGTFYLYFDSKDAVFRELLDDLLTHLRSNVVGIDVRAGAASLEEQLLSTVARILRTVESNRALTRIIFREAVALDAVVEARMRAFNDSLHAFVASALQVGAALGLTLPADEEVVAACVIGTLRGVVQRYVVEGDGPVDVDRVARTVVGYALRGVGG
jgi:AcrR family transcriptional regulator